MRTPLQTRTRAMELIDVLDAAEAQYIADMTAAAERHGICREELQAAMAEIREEYAAARQDMVRVRDSVILH